MGRCWRTWVLTGEVGLLEGQAAYWTGAVYRAPSVTPVTAVGGGLVRPTKFIRELPFIFGDWGQGPV